MNYSILKRLIDLSLVILSSPVSIPICIFVALAVKNEPPVGPVFADIPPRVGQNNKLFRLFKFRSMIPNAVNYLKTHPELLEEYKKNSFKLNHDPRVTKVGKFIRKYSLDEVPQILNVLTGEMSIIGPRPYYEDELEEQQKKYPQTKDLVKAALSVKPGITGEWQVSGRSNVNFDKRIELDAKYAKCISGSPLSALWYDLKILFKTPFVMISGRGAV